MIEWISDQTGAAMIALKLEINGEYKYTAGVENGGILSAVFVMRSGEDTRVPIFNLLVSGFCQFEFSGKRDIVNWKSHLFIFSNEHSVKIVGVETADPHDDRIRIREAGRRFKFIRKEISHTNRLDRV